VPYSSTLDLPELLLIAAQDRLIWSKWSIGVAATSLGSNVFHGAHPFQAKSLVDFAD
jgi:hypothetical protein